MSEIAPIFSHFEKNALSVCSHSSIKHKRSHMHMPIFFAYNDRDKEKDTGKYANLAHKPTKHQLVKDAHLGCVYHIEYEYLTTYITCVSN